MKNKLEIVAGGAGFIGSNLVERIRKKGHEVLVLDNLMLGKQSNLKLLDEQVKFEICDISNSEQLNTVLSKYHNIYSIWHLAANSDISNGINDPSIDYYNTLKTTYNLLDQARKKEIQNFYFASSSAVYGDKGGRPISEAVDLLTPISNYGAAKAASEMLIGSFSHIYHLNSKIFRFPNVVGTPATHGVIFDFINKIIASKKLHVLGDGTQKKAYLHVSDLIDAMLFLANETADENPLIVNIGPPDDGITVKEIAELVCNKFSTTVPIYYESKNIGWIGDVPRFRYDTAKLNKLGFRIPKSSKKAIQKAVDEIFENIHNKK